ncbi:hypothetical protein DICVIV_04192 [Dictyocaulus viviparus]|uniref:Uncharacterized protein n=1 Tax=Dictyocaulus viviparus TaxID=29172 RepID=A0A0D8Y0H4_DICVI|nr:hypothetical protein DICVIV_04192 [Dictyocaulus viviparus]
MKIENKIACFFLVFGTVYFLESIGGFYMTSNQTQVIRFDFNQFNFLFNGFPAFHFVNFQAIQ